MAADLRYNINNNTIVSIILPIAVAEAGEVITVLQEDAEEGIVASAAVDIVVVEGTAKQEAACERTKAGEEQPVVHNVDAAAAAASASVDTATQSSGCSPTSTIPPTVSARSLSSTGYPPLSSIASEDLASSSTTASEPPLI